MLSPCRLPYVMPAESNTVSGQPGPSVAEHGAGTEAGDGPWNQQEEIRKAARCWPMHSMRSHIPHAAKNVGQQPSVQVSLGSGVRRKGSRSTCRAASPVCQHPWKAGQPLSPWGCSSFTHSMTMRELSRSIRCNEELYLVKESQECSSTWKPVL